MTEEAVVTFLPRSCNSKSSSLLRDLDAGMMISHWSSEDNISITSNFPTSWTACVFTQITKLVLYSTMYVRLTMYVLYACTVIYSILYCTVLYIDTTVTVYSIVQYVYSTRLIPVTDCQASTFVCCASKKFFPWHYA